MPRRSEPAGQHRRCTEVQTLAPGHQPSPSGLEQTVDQGGAGEVAVSVPALDDTVGALLAPHHLDLPIDPAVRRENRLAVG